ncbi:hypothetical protein [Sporosarcina sp. E16_8]|nr:hypothetical protein [Sporosarcina sp. E16_8]
MNTDWGMFALYLVFIAGLAIAAHTFEAVGRVRAEKKDNERWK